MRTDPLRRPGLDPNLGGRRGGGWGQRGGGGGVLVLLYKNT